MSDPTVTVEALAEPLVGHFDVCPTALEEVLSALANAMRAGAHVRLDLALEVTPPHAD